MLVGFWLAHGLPAQETGNTVGLTYKAPGSFEGYTLFAPAGSRNAYLIDVHGRLIQRWSTPYLPGQAAYLLEDGRLLRCARLNNPAFVAGGTGGRVEEYDWEGRLVWAFNYSTPQHQQHHDAIKLPNGNVLMIAWEFKSAEQAMAAGRHPALLSQNALWPDTLVEVQPEESSGGVVVWKWSAWDHLVQDLSPDLDHYGRVADHPELIDINHAPSPRADWLHCNGLDYNPDLDQILLSVHAFNEIWVIDHSTTTEQAAGHEGGRQGRGGDLLYRWGNPAAYDTGGAESQQLFGQHNPTWIADGSPGAGHILIFNNGRGRPDGPYSTIVEIVPPVDASGGYTNLAGTAFGPAAPAWTFPSSLTNFFYAQNVSGAQRLPNGNTLVCSGPQGRFFEVSGAGTLLWEYICPVTRNGLLSQGTVPPLQNLVFRSPRYPPDHPGLMGRDLAPHGTVEIDPEAGFELTAIWHDGSDVHLNWNSRPDTLYQVRYRPSLNSTSTWTTLDSVEAIGTSARYRHPSATGRQGFYQLQTGP